MQKSPTRWLKRWRAEVTIFGAETLAGAQESRIYAGGRAGVTNAFAYTRAGVLKSRILRLKHPLA